MIYCLIVLSYAISGHFAIEVYRSVLCRYHLQDYTIPIKSFPLLIELLTTLIYVRDAIYSQTLLSQTGATKPLQTAHFPYFGKTSLDSIFPTPWLVSPPLTLAPVTPSWNHTWLLPALSASGYSRAADSPQLGAHLGPYLSMWQVWSPWAPRMVSRSNMLQLAHPSLHITVT